MYDFYDYIYIYVCVPYVLYAVCVLCVFCCCFHFHLNVKRGDTVSDFNVSNNSATTITAAATLIHISVHHGKYFVDRSVHRIGIVNVYVVAGLRCNLKRHILPLVTLIRTLHRSMQSLLCRF